MLNDFKQFAIKGNVIDLAVGVIIGAAFGKIVNSLVDDVIMPLINPLIPAGDWHNLVVYPGIKIGSFLSVVLNFLIIAFALFVIVQGIHAFKRKEEARQLPPQPVPPSSTDLLLMQIRDALQSTSGGNAPVNRSNEEK